MQRLKGISDPWPDPGCFLSIGNFDGVHLGHQEILRRLVERARAANVPAVLMTFEPHPLTLLNPTQVPERLTTPDEKARLAEAAGVDAVIEYPTDWDLLKLTAREFFQQVVVTAINAQGLVEGPNFFFGNGRSGNVETLAALCEESGRSLDVVPPTLCEGEIISSSAIRAALTRGDVSRARRLLGRPYAVQGVVAKGAGRGRRLGVPTANLEEVATLLPADGVYAAWGTIGGIRGPAAVNIGPNPTFADAARKVEAHLLDSSGEWYGEPMTLEFVDQLRSLRTFETPEALQAQLRQDLEQTRGILAAARMPD